MGRFDNKNTIVKYIEVNLETQEFTQHEEVISYCRSIEKAKKIIEENRGIKGDSNIVISITELQQEQPKQYDSSLLYNYCEVYWSSEEAANAAIKETFTDCVAIKGVMYEIDGYVWIINCDGEFETTHLRRETPTNLNKHDQKATLEMELTNNETALAFANVTKTRVNTWFVIKPSHLEFCEVE